jgi:predicted negative regulator of RcsB-dependent stress response
MGNSALLAPSRPPPSKDLRFRPLSETFPALMPSPTETKPPVEQEFDLLAFWIQYRRTILFFVVLLLVALLSFAVFQLVQFRERESAARELANAKTVEDFRRVVAEHPNSAAGGNALLVLADKLRSENKFDESNAALQQFIEKHPEHPLVSGAWMSLAVNLEKQEKTDEALANYQKVVASYPTSFSAPAAFLAQARIFKTKGKIDEAKRAYETVIAQFGDSVLARVAMQESQQLKK